MAGTLRQLKENISYIQNELKDISADKKKEVFKTNADFLDFSASLQEISEFITRYEKAVATRGYNINLVAMREDLDRTTERLFANEYLALRSSSELQTKDGKLVNKAIKNLTQELDDFNRVFQRMDEKKDIETGMRNLNNRREKTKLEASADRQKIGLKSYLTDVAEQKKDIKEMSQLLKSTKSIFIKNSPYFNALEDSLKALKSFTDKLPQGQTKLNESQAQKLTELYNNAYQAANSYINRNENYTVRGNRMNMAVRLREALRTGAGAHRSLELRQEEEQKKAAKKAQKNKAKAPRKELVSLNRLEKEFEKELGKFDKAPARRNSVAQKSQPSKAPISRQKTLG